MPDLREKRVELILQQLEELPTLPAVALRVLQVTADDHSSAAEVVRLVSSDPALTARILQLIRRADAGVRAEVTTVERAVVLLGFEAVRSAVLAVSVFQTFRARQETDPAQSRFSREAFWKHCLAVACCAELLAEAPPKPAGGRGGINPSDAFICGLLHDLGKVALDAILPKSFARVVEAADLLRGNIADVERQIIGIDHMVAGKRLAERWQLPPSVRDCVWLHGQPPEALPANVKQPRLVNLVTLADSLVREQHLGYSGNYTTLVARGALIEAAGVTAEQVARAMADLVGRIEPRAAALGLGQARSGDLYQEALTQANKELGRVSAQLAAKNRKLSVRSRFFDALSRFQAGMRPDATPQSVLLAIASTATTVLGVNRAAAFSIPPGQDFAEALVCDDAGQVVETALVDLPGMGEVTEAASVAGSVSSLPAPETDWPAVPEMSAGPADGNSLPASQPGDGPVLPAGEGMEWLIGAVSPRLPHDKRFWMCLEADGTCVGGVVWGAPAGEAQRLSPQAPELLAMNSGWGLALRAAQIREEARTLAEHLADANRRLHEAQAEVLRSKAMLTVGEMAAGAAHEMNNPLAVISGRSQLLAQQLTDPKQKAAAQLVFEQSHRLSGIITDLMDFAKPEPPRMRECTASDLINGALRNAKACPDVVDREVVVDVGNVPGIFADPGQMSAALAEVVINALHATDPKTGRVTIDAGYDPYSGRVVVTIADDGCGMDDATAKRAFDPFYSNKPAGRRRGLGLAKALRWVEASGGSIRLDSRPGQGTRVIVLLPAAGPKPPTATQPLPLPATG